MVKNIFPRRIRVMHVCGSKDAGGAETFFMRFIIATKDACEVMPIVRKDSWLDKQLTSAKIPHRTAPFGGMLDFKTKKIIRQVANEFEPQVVQTWMNRASKFLPSLKVPVVGRLGGYYSLKYYNKCDYLVGNTQSICAYLKSKGRPEEDIFYIPNFADTPPSDFKDERWSVRDDYNIPEKAFVMLMAGRLHENKGFDIALAAMKSLPETVHAIIAGNGEQKDMLEAMVEADNLESRVHFTPWLPKISPLAAASDVWLVPSRHEPLGNVVLDGWNHQLPVVAAAVSGPKSLIEDSKNGILVDPESAESIASAIQSLIHNPDYASRIAKDGFEHGQTIFSKSVVVGKWLDFYSQITTDIKA